MGDVRNWRQQRQHGSDEQHDNGNSTKSPPERGWIVQWGWSILAIAAYVTFVMVAVAGQTLGTIKVRFVAIALLSMAAALLWYRSIRIRAAHEAQRDQVIREDLEAARIDQMTWQAFEEHCAQVLGGLGYQEVKKTRPVSGERAVDITAIAPGGIAVAVECKHLSRSVGVPVVRGIIGAVTTGLYKGRAGMLMTSVGVTREAREIAAEGGIEVIDGSRLLEWTVEAMRRLEARAQERLPSRLPQSSASGAGTHRGVRAAVADRIRSLSQPAKVTTAIVCCSAVTVGVAGIMAEASRGTRAGATVPAANARPRPTAAQVAGPARLRPALAAPGTVVTDFFAAISRHDWAKVWLLGGKNLGRGPYRSYSGMISGYAGTVRDVVVTLNVTGGTVSGEFVAHETDRSVRLYQYSYVVRDGTIVSGYLVLLKTTT